MSTMSVKLGSPGGRALVIALRLAVAAVLVWAGVPKLLDPVAFANDISNYHLLPDVVLGPAAVLTPVIELVVAAALVAGVHARGGALVAAAMFLVFTAAMLQAMARGIDLDCGCFGRDASARVGWTSVARNAALLAASALVVMAPDAPWRRRRTDETATRKKPGD